MKKFKWKLDLTDIKGTENVSSKDVFINYLNGALSTCYKDGLQRDSMRRLFKITDKLDHVEGDYLELEDAEFELIETAFERGKFTPQGVKIANQIYNAIEEAKTEGKKDG